MSNLRVKLFLDLVNRLSAPAKAARTDLKGVGQAARDLRKERAGDQIAKDLDRTRASAARTARELRNMKQALRETARTAATMNLAASMGTGRTSAGKGNTAPGIGGKGAMAGAAVAAGRRAMGPLAAGVGVYGAGRATVGQSISFERSMADVKKKVDLPEGKSFADLEKQISSMATTYGRSRDDIAAIVAEAGAAGVAFNDLAGFTELATKASIAWDMPAREAAQKLFEIRSATQSTLPELEAFGDKINALGDTSAAKEKDILEMFQRVGAAAKESNVSTDASLAFLTAMRSVGIGEEVGARGFGALVSKMVTADENTKVAEGLRMIGLDAKAMAKAMKTDATKALLDLFTALEKAKDPTKAAVKIFGQEWFDEMLRTKGAMAEVKKNLETLGNRSKWDGSMGNTLNIELATTDNHLKRLSSLAAEVGDRLGRWALPPINAAIETLIGKMDELDRKAAEREKNIKAGDTMASGGALSPEDRERMARDGSARKTVLERQRDGVAANAHAANKAGRTLKAGEAAGAWSSLQQLAAEKRAIEGKINAGPMAMHEQKALMERLQETDRRIKAISKALGPTIESDGRLGRGAGNHDKTEGLKTSLDLVETRLKTLAELLSSSNNPADRTGFGGMIATSRVDQARAQAELNRKNFPQATAANNFGFGPGGAPEGQQGGKTVGPGLLSFGSGKDIKGAAQGIKDLYNIDLGPAGMTMMERLTGGIRSGQSNVEGAAQSAGDGVKNKLSGIDLSSAGQAMMASLANGIRAGEGPAIAAAQAAAAKIKSAMAVGGAGGSAKGTVKTALGRSLHDGVV